MTENTIVENRPQPRRRQPRNQTRLRQPKQTIIKDTLKIIPLGGLDEIGRNMTVIEYKDDIVIVDMGLQFPEEGMPGIDYIIPNISYLKGKEKNIRGVLITHGHYDHIGAIPHLMPKLGNPPIFTAALTRGIILKRQDDFPDAPKLEIHTVTKNDKIKLGDFEVEFFHVNHNIPDGLGLFIKTPTGSIVHTGDFKFDHSPVGDEPADISAIANIGSQNVLCLMSDSCNAEAPGYTISEKNIQENLEGIFKSAPGRIIVATFASLLTRVQQIITLSEKYGRKVAIDGYGMRMNVEIAKELGYLKIEKGTLIQPKEINNYPENRVLLMCTGAQGEGNAVLMRIANREHQSIEIQRGDSIVFSSSVVPGNERTVQSLKDILVKQGAKIYHSPFMDIHASGHGQQEDLKMMINLIKPKFFIPVHGNYYMLQLHAELAESVGIPHENIVVAGNGKIIHLTKDKIWMDKTERALTSYVMVDGLGVGDVGQIVLRDRQAMAKDGMFVIIVTIDSQNGKVKNSPDIISRGFIYMRESKELLYEVREKVKSIVHSATGDQGPINETYIKENIRDKIGQFLYNKTQRRPMVLPVVIEV
ncbi:MAG: ribonuclease J [Candidatus Portnoybacteria bacterium]|nr:ribonuclease J [Candidatus Portnoybacteria bacterium]